MNVKVLHSSALLLRLFKRVRKCFKRKFVKKRPILILCVVGMPLATHVYLKQKVYAFFRVFVFTRVYVYPKNITQELFSFFLQYAGKNIYVLGIFLYNPLPRVYDKTSLYYYVPTEKDVDGLGVGYTIKNLYDKTIVVPCTAAGVLSVLKQMKYCVTAKSVVVLSTTNTVGMPLVREFLRKKAVVTVLNNVGAQTIKCTVRKADVIITATGVPGTIKSSWLQKGAVLIDIGVYKKFANGFTQGDVVYDTGVLQNIIVPRSVGRATLAHALLNTMVLYKKYVES